MKILRNELKSELKMRTEKDYPIKGIEFIDIMPLIIQKDVFSEIINAFIKEISLLDIDYIIAPEARGFLLASPIAYNLNIGCIPIRKKSKLPPSTIEIEFSYEKEYGKDFLALPKLVDEIYKDKNFYIIDDIYATGNTISEIGKAIQSLGGNIVGKGVILNIINLNNDRDVFSLIDINED